MSAKVKSFNDKVYEIVSRIPKGRVTTYGDVARVLGNPRMARQVGWALHANRSNDVPCHRVVNRDGRLAPNFGGPSLGSFGHLAFSAKGGPVSGWDGVREQRRRLEQEGIVFVDQMHVDLSRCLWK